MSLSQSQLIILKADIIADSILNAWPNESGGAFEIAKAYNAIASPQFVVWRTNIPAHECKGAMVWTEFIARTIGEQQAWQFMLSDGSINASDINVRQGIQDIFSGAGGAGTRAALINIAKRDATRGEKLFAIGTGSVGSPATLTIEGSISYNDIDIARHLP